MTWYLSRSEQALAALRLLAASLTRAGT
jgi:hypothetical protein